MARVDLSDLERTEAPRERVRRWFGDALVLFGLGAVAWHIGESSVTLLSKGGWFAAVTAAGLAFVAFLWFRWSAWSLRAKLLCAVLFISTFAVPLTRHYA
jgi:hypothetical protein